MTRPAGRRRLPALAALALLCLCLVALVGGDASGGRRALHVSARAGLADRTGSVARRFGLPRRLAQAAEGEDESSELESTALEDEE